MHACMKHVGCHSVHAARWRGASPALPTHACMARVSPCFSAVAFLSIAALSTSGCSLAAASMMAARVALLEQAALASAP